MNDDPILEERPTNTVPIEGLVAKTESEIILEELNDGKQPTEEVADPNDEGFTIDFNGDDIDPTEVTFFEDNKDEIPSLTKEDREELEEFRTALNNEVITDPVYNAIIEPIKDGSNIDKTTKSVIDGLTDENSASINILPSYKVDAEMRSLTNKMFDARLRGDTEQVLYFSRIIEAIRQTADASGTSETFFNREGAMFEQGVRLDNGNLVTMSGLKPSFKGDKLEGNAALLRAMQAFDMGEVVNIPLVHSGFWVMINPPSEWDIVRFYELVNRDLVKLGRDTVGYIFSNGSVKTFRDTLNFIMQHVRSTSLKDVDKADIRPLIDIRDLPTLIWGLAKAIYPRGFPFRRRCDDYETRVLNKEGELESVCSSIEEVNYHLDKMYHVDNTKINASQRKIIGMLQPNSITNAQREEYLSYFDAKTTTLEYKDAILTIVNPNAEVYFDDGMAWIEDIMTEYNRVLATSSLDAKAKKDTLSSYINSSSMRNWSHYVKNIKFKSDGKSIERREDIQNIISLWGADKEFTVDFVTKVVEFRNASLVTSIGVEEYKCVKCGKLQEGNNDAKLANIIPIAPLNVFFLMLITKYQTLTISMTDD